MKAPQKDFNNLKQWLQPKIEATGMSIEDFANSIGVTRMTIYHYLNDTHRPSTQVMAKICNTLGVPLEEGLRQYSVKKAGRPAGKYYG